jgi:hypothetical protein
MLLLAIVGLTSCATQSACQYLKTFEASKYKTIKVEDCVDRTTNPTTRDIAGEATKNLLEKISELGLFEITSDGELVLICDVERFAEGSAFKRWLMLGWGTTKAKITVMISEKASQSVMTILSTVASVESGGLYTQGADRYIIGVVMDDIVTQIKNMPQLPTK